MSWLFSQALAVEYSAGTCLDGAPSAQLNVTDGQHKFWHNGKTMDASNHSRFGLTLRLLTDAHGEELLMSFLADFPVRTLAAPAKALDSTANEVDSGIKWQGSFARWDRDLSTWKTVQCSLFADLEPSLVIWPRWGSMRNGVCSERRTLAPRMSETASGSRLPTLTLVSCEHPGRRKIKDHQQTCISAVLAKRDNWAHGGQYSQSHAAWFMGWPDLWTSLDHSVTDKFRKWQQQHGGF